MFMVVIYSMGIKPLPSRVLPTSTSSSVSRYIKPTITYLIHSIVSIYGMSSCEYIQSIDDIVSFIMTDDTVNMPVIPYYSGIRVDTYYSILQTC